MQQLESSKLFSASLVCQNTFLLRYKEGKGQSPRRAPCQIHSRKHGMPAVATVSWAQQNASNLYPGDGMKLGRLMEKLNQPQKKGERHLKQNCPEIIFISSFVCEVMWSSVDIWWTFTYQVHLPGSWGHWGEVSPLHGQASFPKPRKFNLTQAQKQSNSFPSQVTPSERFWARILTIRLEK